jgi:HlyD family secretion protein
MEAMDAEKLRALQIAPEAKSRPQRPMWLIFGAVLVLTGTAFFFAWPRLADKKRVFAGKGSTKTAAATAVSPSSPPAESPATTPAAIGSSNGEPILTVSGYIINRERIEISPRFMGVVKWIGVKKGDAVTNGQVVVLLDDAEQQARLIEAQGRLATATTAVTKAEIDYERVRKLIAQNIETQQLEDELRLKLASAHASVREVEGTVELAKTYLSWTIIKSPINGVVLEKLAEANELVTPQSFGGTRGPSTALIAVADPKDLQVEIDLNEADLAKVYMNQRCRVTPEAYQDKSYEGYVAERAPEANRQKGTLQVKVQIRDPDQFLTPELTAKVEFLR